MPFPQWSPPYTYSGLAYRFDFLLLAYMKSRSHRKTKNRQAKKNKDFFTRNKEKGLQSSVSENSSSFFSSSPNRIHKKRGLAISRPSSDTPHVMKQGGSSPSVRVWGFPVGRNMCGCHQDINEAIVNANHFRSEYQACNIPANKDADAVEACVDARNPGSTTEGETDASGNVTVHTPATTPCERITHRATRVHETFHRRQANSIARRVGGNFFRDWQTLRGNPRRLDILRSRYPGEGAAFDAIWDSRQDWVAGEVESYTWERRFLVDVRRTLREICP